jgi:hypothetical protein
MTFKSVSPEQLKISHLLKFNSRPIFQNLVRLSQIKKKKSPSDYTRVNSVKKIRKKKIQLLMFHNRAFSIASKNDIDD